ncbi:MAG: hypothetical protein ACK5V3_05930 [Bdellovibrionales bacterium]
MNKRSLSVLYFCLFALLPAIPIVTSFYEIRHAVVFDQPVRWQEGETKRWDLPKLQANSYEFRLESDQSKWEPIIKARWQVVSGNQSLAKSSELGQEWNMVRPFLQTKFEEPIESGVIELQFLNTAKESHPVRLKVSLDRGVILEKQTRLFIILLAFSLGFIVLIWKPFLTVSDEAVASDK